MNVFRIRENTEIDNDKNESGNQGDGTHLGRGGGDGRLMDRLFAGMAGRHFHLGDGVEHVIEPVPVVVVERDRPSGALGDAPLGQQRGRHGVATGPRLHARGHRLAVRHRELQRGVEPLPVRSPLQQTRRRGPRGRRARVTGQQFPLAHALVAVVTVVGHVPLTRTPAADEIFYRLFL